MEDDQAAYRAKVVIESVIGKADGRGVPEISRAALRMQDGSLIGAADATPGR